MGSGRPKGNTKEGDNIGCGHKFNVRCSNLSDVINIKGVISSAEQG